MAKARRRRAPSPSDTHDEERRSELRIIGGQFRGRKLQYSGRFGTRPMKERVREAIFNLVGPAIRGTHAIDMFAGTGILGLEAISRGAASATLIEQHVPTSTVIRENAKHLGVEEQAEVTAANAFIWIRQNHELPPRPWCVFISPPYEFYLSRRDDMRTLIERVLAKAPPESIFAVEADERADLSLLPDADAWDVRTYPPAVVGILRR